MIYNDGFPVDEDMRVKICPKCKNEEMSEDAEYCRICGTPLFNMCEGEEIYDYNGNYEGLEQHIVYQKREEARMKHSLSDILIKALGENDIGGLIRNVSLYLDYPVMLTDADFNLIDCYPEGKLDDPLWDTILQYGTVPIEFIDKMHIDGTLKYSANNSEPYVLDWGFLEGTPRVLVNLTRNHKYYGHLTILCNDHSADLFENMKSIGAVLSVLLEQQYMDGVMADDYQTLFMNYLLNAKDTEQDHLEKWVANFNISLQSPYYLMYSMSNNKKQPAGNMKQIKEIIRHLYPDALSAVKNNELIVLFTDTDLQERTGSIAAKIREAVSAYNIILGFSNKFYELDKLHIYLQQAKYAWSAAMDGKADYMEYRDCILQNMISSVYSSLPRNSYEHDGVAKIREYDGKNNTEYLKTLSVYTDSLFNAAETVRRLYIHRNTLPHRLEMIEKIGQLDLSNPETCTVLMMNHYMNLF